MRITEAGGGKYTRGRSHTDTSKKKDKKARQEDLQSSASRSADQPATIDIPSDAAVAVIIQENLDFCQHVAPNIGDVPSYLRLRIRLRLICG